MHKSVGLDDTHPRVQKEMADVVAEPLSIIFEKPWLVKSPVTGKKGNITPIFKKGRKEDWGKLQAGAPHLCAWEDHGADPPRSYVEARMRQRSDSRQTAWLHQGQILPDQSGGLL